MPTKAEVIQDENQQSNRITLYRQGNFWRLYEQSAFLLIHHFNWPDIQVMGGYYKSANAEVYHVGFPVKSLQSRVLNKLPEVVGAIITTFSDNKIVIDKVPEIQGFQEWKKAQGEKKVKEEITRNDIADSMIPYYGNLPIFKATYDLLNRLVNIVRHFQRDVKYVLGERIISESMQLNELIYKLLKETEKGRKTPSKSKEYFTNIEYEQEILIHEIDKKIESLRLLLRISFDNKLHDSEAHTQFAKTLDNIRKQYHAWNKKTILAAIDSLQTFTEPITPQENTSGTLSINWTSS